MRIFSLRNYSAHTSRNTHTYCTFYCTGLVFLHDSIPSIIFALLCKLFIPYFTPLQISLLPGLFLEFLASVLAQMADLTYTRKFGNMPPQFSVFLLSATCGFITCAGEFFVFFLLQQNSLLQKTANNIATIKLNTIFFKTIDTAANFEQQTITQHSPPIPFRLRLLRYKNKCS